MIVNLRQSGVKNKKGKNIVPIWRKNESFDTAEVDIAALTRQSAPGGFKWQSNWTSGCGDIQFYVFTTFIYGENG